MAQGHPKLIYSVILECKNQIDIFTNQKIIVLSGNNGRVMSDSITEFLHTKVDCHYFVGTRNRFIAAALLHMMELHDDVIKWKLSALLAICARNSPVTGEFPAQRPVTRNCDVFFDLRPNKLLSKQSWGW